MSAATAAVTPPDEVDGGSVTQLPALPPPSMRHTTTKRHTDLLTTLRTLDTAGLPLGPAATPVRAAQDPNTGVWHHPRCPETDTTNLPHVRQTLPQLARTRGSNPGGPQLGCGHCRDLLIGPHAHAAVASYRMAAQFQHTLDRLDRQHTACGHTGYQQLCRIATSLHIWQHNLQGRPPLADTVATVVEPIFDDTAQRIRQAAVAWQTFDPQRAIDLVILTDEKPFPSRVEGFTDGSWRTAIWNQWAELVPAVGRQTALTKLHELVDSRTTLKGDPGMRLQPHELTADERQQLHDDIDRVAGDWTSTLATVADNDRNKPHQLVAVTGGTGRLTRQLLDLWPSAHVLQPMARQLGLVTVPHPVGRYINMTTDTSGRLNNTKPSTARYVHLCPTFGTVDQQLLQAAVRTADVPDMPKTAGQLEQHMLRAVAAAAAALGRSSPGWLRRPGDADPS